ncbi:hypothetical protein DM01DRAFT_1331203 [Hesseltinella vesiculosa]|uniref:RRM domain-containing protein n=1 Tax=Hesseltinella vesiculosa TaxID=101127 RepID=A0A1X2GYF9_9FUNG|nr:hypothetical protein DM01DRAFT_1331203 [Hesseltinella vesiculosa]
MISEPSYIPYSSYLPERVHPLSSSPSAFTPSPMTFLNSPPSHAPSFLSEEVTTIFVVGFPDDMQEREFQNMFMFSPGFEAASLKWHYKDQDDDTAQVPLNSKKQMIGFARFRTRRQALEAVEVISGKKVDQEKGFTLKAEMAKKNLHVKRGSVAHLTTIDTAQSNSSASTGGLTSPLDNSKKFMLGQQQQHFTEPFAFTPLPSDLLSPITDYKTDPFMDPAIPPSLNAVTPTTPVFHDPLFAFRSYSMDARAANNNPPPPPPFVPRANSIAPGVSRLKSSPLPPPPLPTTTSSAHIAHPLQQPAALDDPFHYLSKSSPMPMERLPSLFDESPFFRSNTNTSTIPSHTTHTASQHYPLHHPLQPDFANLSLNPMKKSLHTPLPSSSSTTTSNMNNHTPSSSSSSSTPPPSSVPPPSTSPTATPSAPLNNTNLADQNPPCNTLYVGNLPINTSEDELRQLFSKCTGYKRMYFRTKPQGPMCFVEFEDVSFATLIMNDLQGHALSNSVKGGIRLSFSKNPLFTKPSKNTQSFDPPL